MERYIGAKLEGRYFIEELIGKGGMANVYKAYDVIDQRTVAVKILRDEFLNNSDFLRRFKNESKAIALLSHPNIVKVYDVSFTNKVHSIVMEHIDGITLKDYIEKEGPLSYREALHFTLQILRALQHAHDKGIVHRDIKPQNIMLLKNGTIKVTDFGIARFARSESHTITDHAIGSVHYISPEQAMGSDTDEKTDIYSVGVMLFEMLTGELPFEADSAVSVAIKQIQTEARNPRSINPSIPEGLEEITIRAMQKDSAKRYRSAAEMIVDIERFKENPEISFEYKYLAEDPVPAQNKRYTRAVNKARSSGDNMVGNKKRTPYIPILTGVTLAFVLAAAAFIGIMLYMNNPFRVVGETELPDLEGLKFETASAQYDDFEIIVEEEVYNDVYANGMIIKQNPKAGSKIKYGGTVKVTVSVGQQNMEMPNFTNIDATQVFQKLTDMGLEYKQESVFSEETVIGCVVYTDPSKGTEVTSGTMVTVYVSRGKEEPLTTVPDLDGMQLDDARELLEKGFLILGTVTEEASDRPAGIVISQTPAAGELQPEGTEISLVISKEGSKRLVLPITLPKVNRSLTIRARVGEDSEVVASDNINPIEDGIAVWKPVIPGTEEDTNMQVKIYIDGQLYVEYFLDFENETMTKGTDRMDASIFS